MVNIYCSIKVYIFILAYFLTKYRYRNRDISSISYRYRIKIEKVVSKHHYYMNVAAFYSRECMNFNIMLNKR